MLNDASTNEERLAALKVYNQQYTENVKSAVADQLKLQLDASAQHLEEIAEIDGEQGEEYRKAYAAWLKDNEAYNTALTAQSVNAAKETAKSIEDYEKEIQTAKQETARIEKETLDKTTTNRKEFLNGLANLVSQDGGLMGQVGAGLIAMYNSLDELHLGALKAAQDNLGIAKTTLSAIQEVYSDGSAEGDAKIAEAEKSVAKAEDGVAKAQGMSLQAGIAIAGTIYQILSTIASAYNEHMKEVYQAVADGLGKVRDAYKTLFDFVDQASAGAATFDWTLS